MVNKKNKVIYAIVAVLIFVMCCGGYLFSQDRDGTFEQKPDKKFKKNYLKIGGAFFSPSESRFKNIYGEGAQFGGELGIHLWKGIGIWFGGSYYKQSGKLSFSQEYTSVEVFPLGGGLNFHLPLGGFNLYTGAGLLYYSFKESNVVMNTSAKELGYIGKVGCFIVMGDGFVFDIHVDYTYCQIKPSNVRVNIGGISPGASLGFLF